MSSTIARDVSLLVAGCILTLAAMYVIKGDKRLEKPSNNGKNLETPIDFRIVIHGGAGVIAKTIDGQPYNCALRKILVDTAEFAKGSGVSALDVVEFAVIQLENDPLFNAGRGAVFTADETHELEASIMDGSSLRCGAASLVQTFKNPICLARLVMENTVHNYLVGEKAHNALDTDGKLERVQPDYFSTEKRLDQLRTAKQRRGVFVDHDLQEKVIKSKASGVPGGMGTVGCVCMLNGHVAAATSTGGMTNKLPGRVGDTPIIGAGTYANDKSVAVSATGSGEEFMRHVAAFDVASRISVGHRSLQAACKETVFDILPAESGGLIAINCFGDYAMEFNSPGMFRGVCDSTGIISVGIWENMQTL